MNKKNLVLIGMPGAGKSTLGVLLAKTLKMPFVDTDLLIQEREDKLLQEIIDAKGLKAFLKAEEEAIRSLNLTGRVIATGGSAVYSPAAMAHLKDNGLIIYLKLSYTELERRITNIKTRGIAMERGKSLRELYLERLPLYEKYADNVIDCDMKHAEDIIRIICDEIKILL